MWGETHIIIIINFDYFGFLGFIPYNQHNHILYYIDYMGQMTVCIFIVQFRAIKFIINNTYTYRGAAKVNLMMKNYHNSAPVN